VVVGAGIVGAAVAEALAMDGARVTIIDQGEPGGGATATGMGHIVVMDDSEPQIALSAYSQRLWDERASQLPAAAERLVCGTLWIAATDDEMSEVSRKHQLYQRRGIRAEILDRKDLADAEPMLRQGLFGALRVPGDSALYPPPVVETMLQTIRRHGGVMRFGQRVTEMRGHVVHLADGSVLECDYAVNAAGPAAAKLTAGCPVRPRKGHLVITDRYPGFARHQLIELGYLHSAHSPDDSSVAFNVQPRPNGQLLIGSSREFDDQSPEIHFDILARMLNRAIEYMPAIGSLSCVRAWTGLRPAAPDNLPFIGPHPDDPRLLLATGHEGLGITTSLGTARLIADHIAGRKPEIPPEPYRPTRLREARSAAHSHGAPKVTVHVNPNAKNLHRTPPMPASVETLAAAGSER
jgi:glycine/D-amino acid oxidase-like deaminating enzyme